MNKREKKSNFLNIFLLFGAILAFILIVTFIISSGRQQKFSGPTKFIFDVIGHGQQIVTSVSGKATGFISSYVDLRHVREENRQLREELAKFKKVNNEYLEAVATNVRLANLLKLKESLPSPTLTTQIVGRDHSMWFKTVIIDRGSSDGIQAGMPVVTIEGIVGQIINVSPHFAKVLLANDPTSAIDVLIQKSRIHGIIKGKGTEGYQLHYILKNSDVEQGYAIVTSGLDGVFPKGLPVGTVSSVARNKRGMFQKIKIKPAVDFSELEYLIIIMRESSLVH
jgi:rod shape-determining protein MreC